MHSWHTLSQEDPKWCCRRELVASLWLSPLLLPVARGSRLPLLCLDHSYSYDNRLLFDNSGSSSPFSVAYGRLAVMASDAVPSAVDIGWRLETFIAVFTPLCIGAVALRFYARSLTVERYSAGDALILAALVGQVVAGGIAIGKAQRGWKRHRDRLD